MDIKMNGLSYQFADNGDVNGAQVTFNGSQDTDFVNAQVKIVATDLNKKTFKDVTPNDLQTIAQGKLKDYVDKAFVAQTQATQASAQATATPTQPASTDTKPAEQTTTTTTTPKA